MWSSNLQSERQDWKAAEISSKDIRRCWRTRRSDLDESLMRLCNLVSMRLINRESGRRMVDELSDLSGWRSGRQERTSGPARRQPEMWMILRSKSARLSNHRAWRRLRFWA